MLSFSPHCDSLCLPHLIVIPHDHVFLSELVTSHWQEAHDACWVHCGFFCLDPCPMFL